MQGSEGDSDDDGSEEDSVSKVESALDKPGVASEALLSATGKAAGT